MKRLINGIKAAINDFKEGFKFGYKIAREVDKGNEIIIKNNRLYVIRRFK